MKGESSQGQLGREVEGQVVGGCGEEVGVGRGVDGGVGGPFNFRNSKPSGKMSSFGLMLTRQTNVRKEVLF